MAATIAGSALIATYPTVRLATGLDPHILRLAFAIFLATICRDRRLPHVAWCCQSRGRADASLGVDNHPRRYRWRVLGVFRSRWGVRCAATADDVLRIAAVGGARSSIGPLFPERTDRIAGLCRSR
jgi:hypothetical protein